MPKKASEPDLYTGEYEWVIGYGCERAQRVVKVAVAERPPPNAAPAAFDCPACGIQHRVAIQARHRHLDESVDLELPAVPR